MKKWKGILIGREVKLFLFPYDMILYVKKKIKTTHTDTTHACVHTHTYTHTHELCFRTNKCIQQSCKMQKSVALVSTNNKQFERETKKTIPFTLATKEIKYLGINQKDEKLVY